MKAADVVEGTPLMQRHKNNPNGLWKHMGSLADRLPQHDVIAAFEDNRCKDGWRWEAVEFPHGGARRGAGRPEGIEEATPRKRKRKKKDGKKIDSKVDA